MKRTITLLASMALVASGLHILPAAAAEEAPAVPDVANIEDPFGDANFLGGDQVTPADGGSLSDIGKVWFSHDATNFNAHFLTEGAPGSPTQVGLFFEVKAGDAGCLVFEGFSKGTTYASDNLGRVTDNCNKLERTVGTFTFVPAGTAGLATISIPRSYSPLFADGGTITAPVAQTRIFVGGEQLTPSGYRGVGQRVDDTKPGTDYAIAGGEPTKPAKPAKPVKPVKPTTPVKNGCDNGKGKKKGCKKTPKPKSCAAFTPGEAGKDKPTITLTDAATEEKPVEQTVTLEQSTADIEGDATFDYFNVVVDSEAAAAGLYAKFEFPTARDYDIDLLHTDGSYAARSHGFNPIGPLYAVPPFAGSEGHGGKTTASSESLVGIKTNDCGGWTIQASNHLGEGGELTVTLWLGEAQIDPQEAGAETP